MKKYHRHLRPETGHKLDHDTYLGALAATVRDLPTDDRKELRDLFAKVIWGAEDAPGDYLERGDPDLAHWREAVTEHAEMVIESLEDLGQQADQSQAGEEDKNE